MSEHNEEAVVEETTAEPVVEETTKAEETQDNGVDYKSILAEREAEIEKLKMVANNQRVALQKQRKETKKTQSTPDEEESAAERAARLAVQEVETRRREEDIESIVESLTDNEDEAKLIMLTYENDIRHAGYSKKQIKDDLEKAQLLANRTKFMAKAEKQARKSVAEEAALKGASQQPPSKVEEPEKKRRLTAAEKKYLRKFGVDVD